MHSPFRHVRTRLYFTSESHLHSLINVLQYAHLDKPREDRERGRSPYHTEHSESDVDAKGPTKRTPTKGSSRGSKVPPGLPLGSPNKEENATSAAKSSVSSTNQTVRPSLINDALGALFKREKELDYLTHIVFRMFERFHVPPSDPRRFRIEILFSNGVSLHPFETNAIELFDNSTRDGVADEDEEMISDDLLKEIQIQNDKIMPGQEYLTLSTMEEYLVNYNRRWNKGGDSTDGTPGKGARSSSVGSERKWAGKNLFAS